MSIYINDSQNQYSQLKSRFAMFVHFFVGKMPEALDLDLSGCLEAGSDACWDPESSADLGGFNETRQVVVSCTKHC